MCSTRIKVVISFIHSILVVTIMSNYKQNKWTKNNNNDTNDERKTHLLVQPCDFFGVFILKLLMMFHWFGNVCWWLSTVLVSFCHFSVFHCLSHSVCLSLSFSRCISVSVSLRPNCRNAVYLFTLLLRVKSFFLFNGRATEACC